MTHASPVLVYYHIIEKLSATLGAPPARACCAHRHEVFGGAGPGDAGQYAR